jgi:hypothetical protein
VVKGLFLAMPAKNKPLTTATSEQNNLRRSTADSDRIS